MHCSYSSKHPVTAITGKRVLGQMDLCSYPVLKEPGSNTHSTGKCQDRHHCSDSKIWIFRPVKQIQGYATVSSISHVLRGCNNGNSDISYRGWHKVPAKSLPYTNKAASSWAGTPKACLVHSCTGTTLEIQVPCLTWRQETTAPRAAAASLLLKPRG